MKFHYYTLCIIFLVGCKDQPNGNNLVSVDLPDVAIQKSVETEPVSQRRETIDLEQFDKNRKTDTYVQIKKSIDSVRLRLRASDSSIKLRSKVFHESLLNRIIPCWNGTKWSFEGHTSVPKTGHIACGYFVSTTLKDIGLNLNRYKLAQQNPLNEAKSLAMGSSVRRIAGDSTEESIELIKRQLKDGIHLLVLTKVMWALC